MKFRTLASATFAVALFTIGAAVARAEEKAVAGINAQRFEALKKLAGDWVAVGKDGKPTEQVVSSFRVTSGGTALQETIFPGTEKEMVTLYHLDGEDLVLTHYCMLGNQPHMRAEPGKDVNTIAFKFAGCSNLKSADEHHMHDATFTLEGSDHYKVEYSSCQDGKSGEAMKFELVRKQK
jgi:hypothetical protein